MYNFDDLAELQFEFENLSESLRTNNTVLNEISDVLDETSEKFAQIHDSLDECLRSLSAMMGYSASVRAMSASLREALNAPEENFMSHSK